jgi:hypothetical protein
VNVGKCVTEKKKKKKKKKKKNPMFMGGKGFGVREVIPQFLIKNDR